MKHFNNSLDGNVNLSNIPEFKPDYSPKTEGFFVSMLIILGIVGAVYTFNIGFKSSLHNKNTLTRNVAPVVFAANGHSATPTKRTTEKNSSKAQLKIVGEKEANQNMLFTIESFDKKANYVLKMGNGETIYPKNKTVAYTYKKPGNYEIQLNVNYNGQSKLIFSNEIQILESIAIAPGALNEY